MAQSTVVEPVGADAEGREITPTPGVGGWTLLMLIHGAICAVIHLDRSTAEDVDNVKRVTIYIGIPGQAAILKIDLFTANGIQAHIHLHPRHDLTEAIYSLTKTNKMTDVQAGVLLFRQPDFMRAYLSLADELDLAYRARDGVWHEAAEKLEQLAA